VRSIFWAGCLVGLALVAAGEAAGQGTEVMRLPAAVEEAAKANWPVAQVLGFKKKLKDGRSLWKLDLQDGERDWQASFSDGGELIGTEEVVEASTLPDPVQKAVEKKFPDGAITEVKRETIGDRTSAKVVYEVETTKGQLTVDPNGKVLRVK